MLHCAAKGAGTSVVAFRTADHRRIGQEQTQRVPPYDTGGGLPQARPR